jgi:hypothetical protein
LSGVIASPAHAGYTQFEIDTVAGQLFTGTFTLDEDLRPLAFGTWNITGHFPDISHLYTPGFQTPQDFNSGDSHDDALIQQSNLLEKFNFEVDETTHTFKADAMLDGGANLIETKVGKYHAVAQNVPEPAAAVLLAIGLLALAGLGWLPREMHGRSWGKPPATHRHHH